MDCLKSFALTTTNVATYTVASGAVDVWGTNNNFNILAPLISNFNVQGFKNINVFGLDIIGNASSGYGNAVDRINNANALDWDVTIQLGGQVPLVGGVLGVNNDWPIITNQPFTQQNYVLSKYKTSVRFESPIESVKTISLLDFHAMGNGAESVLQVRMGYFFQVMVYYKFEGE